MCARLYLRAEPLRWHLTLAIKQALNTLSLTCKRLACHHDCSPTQSFSAISLLERACLPFASGPIVQTKPTIKEYELCQIRLDVLIESDCTHIGAAFVSYTIREPDMEPGIFQVNSRAATPMDVQVTSDHFSSEDDTITIDSTSGSHGSRTSSHGAHDPQPNQHIIELSSVEHCMPRAYIRICLAYRVASDQSCDDAIERLQQYFNKVVRAKPYLAGVVIDVTPEGRTTGRAQIRFTTEQYLNPAPITVKTLHGQDGRLLRYDELDEQSLPPSCLVPDNVSALPPNIDPRQEAPLLRVQANKVEGGLIVSIYLHHCSSDGAGFDFITSGNLLNDKFTFPWPSSSVPNKHGLRGQLRKYAQHKSIIRQTLSYAPPGTRNTRGLQAKRLDEPPRPANAPGRGCVVMLSSRKILALKENFLMDGSNEPHSTHTTISVVMALLWRYMTRARRPSIMHNTNVSVSKLLIPVNIRGKVGLPEEYFGAAVDSGIAKLDLDSLTRPEMMPLQEVSQLIRTAIDEVDEEYLWESIAFANSADAQTEVHDLQACNMDRVTGADMYITSWLNMGTYHHDLDMGLGKPDWVRKPWSRDPGSCIILPRKSDQAAYFEVVVQMSEVDMSRLLADQEFTEYVVKVID